ncbi:MAG: flavodoxin domain-containing protein [Clostridiales bacterium]|nr:flavodoxin domain-containing protein [Clostridiales bacterium]
MKTLVTYQSKTGFTKKYAEWISEELNSDLKEIKQVSEKDIANYDIVIHGGWIMGGVINGFNKIMKLNPKKLIVFGVGYTPKDKVDIEQLKQANNLGETPFFYYEGGTNPKEMGFMGRTIVKMVTKEEVTFKDNTDKNAIAKLIEAVSE